MIMNKKFFILPSTLIMLSVGLGLSFGVNIKYICSNTIYYPSELEQQPQRNHLLDRLMPSSRENECASSHFIMSDSDWSRDYRRALI